MNAPFRMPVAATGTALTAMLALHRKMSAMREEHPCLPDEAYDSLSDSIEHVENEIIETKVHSTRDIATKLHLLADLMDSDGGEHKSEITMLLVILQNLRDLRNPEWQSLYRCDHPLTHLFGRLQE